MTQNETKKMLGKIQSILLQIDKGYAIREGCFGVWNIIDTRNGNKLITSGILPHILARVESMLKDAQKES